MSVAPQVSRIGRRAFTLIELLIVIGIIALLISIILPTVGRVREFAKTAECMSNLSQIGKAATAYTTKYDGYLIPGYANPAVKTNGGGESGDAENYATLLINEKMVTSPTLATMGSEVQTRASVFRCPSGNENVLWSQFADSAGNSPIPTDRKDQLAARPLRIKSLRSGIVVDTWYGINAVIRDYNTIKTPYRRIPASPDATDWRLNTVNDLKDSSRTVFLFDGIFMHLHYEADRLSARHNNQTVTNLLFADGHAEAVVTKSLPGGLGPNSPGTDLFSKAALGVSPTYVWRTDQK